VLGLNVELRLVNVLWKKYRKICIVSDQETLACLENIRDGKLFSLSLISRLSFWLYLASLLKFVSLFHHLATFIPWYPVLQSYSAVTYTYTGWAKKPDNF